MSHLKRSHVMAAFIKTLHLLLKIGWGGSVLAGYKRVVSPLLILLLTTSFEINPFFLLYVCVSDLQVGVHLCFCL